jgi:hypothetical protein
MKRSLKITGSQILLILGLLSLLTLLVACQPAQESIEEGPKEVEAKQEPASAAQFIDEQLTEMANEACDTLQKNLGTQLKAALKAGGPIAALSVCNTVAQPITSSTSDSLKGIAVTRTALKVRNPLNAPTEQDQSVLESWEESIGSNSEGGPLEPKLIHISKGEALFYRPIMIQEVCLKCHGSPADFSKELSEQLARIYPNDAATGYQPGQLRGAFKVSMNLTEVVNRITE